MGRERFNSVTVTIIAVTVIAVTVTVIATVIAGHPHPRVDVAGVMAADMAEGSAKPVLVARIGDDVDVVGQQAIGPDRHLRSRRRFRQQVEVQRIFAILEKSVLAVVAASDDMMRNAGKNNGREPGPWRRLGARTGK